MKTTGNTMPGIKVKLDTERSIRQGLKCLVSKKNWIQSEVLGKNWKDRIKMTGNQMSGSK